MFRFSHFAQVLTFTLASAVISATAADWNGPPDGNWNDADNWQPQDVPTSADVVSIASGSVVVDTPDAEADRLILGVDTESETGGSLTVQDAGGGTTWGDTYVYAHSALTIIGAGSSWSVGGDLAVMGTGSQVTVADGGALTSDDGSSSSFVDYGGSVVVTGAGSTWSNLRFLDVYTGSLLFDDNASVTTGGTGLSSFFNDNVSTVTVRNNAQWVTDELAIGGQGTATVNLESGGQLTSNGVLTIGVGSALNVGTGGSAGVLSANLVENGGMVSFNHTDAVLYDGNIGDLVIDDGCSDPIISAGNVAKQGSGTLTLTGFNTWSGSTLIEGGTLEVGYDYALPSASAVSVSGGATLVVNEGIYAEIGSLEGAGAVEIGSYGILAVGANDASTTFSGSITSTGDWGDFEKTGSGTLTLTGTSSINGYLSLCGCSPDNALAIDGGSFTALDGVDISGGTLSILNGGRLQTEAIQLVGGTFQVTGTGSTVETGIFQAAGVFDSISVEIGAGASLEATDALLIIGDAALTVDGTISGDAITIVAIGGSISGLGTVGDLVVTEGGLLSPGHSPGTLHAGNTTWDSGGAYLWEINSATGAQSTSRDLLVSDGVLALDSIDPENPFLIFVVSLDADNNPGDAADFDPLQTYTWTLATATCGITGFDSGNFVIDASGFSNAPDSSRFLISSDGTNLNLTYSPVPEPVHWGAALGLGLFGLAGLRHRQRRKMAGR